MNPCKTNINLWLFSGGLRPYLSAGVAEVPEAVRLPRHLPTQQLHNRRQSEECLGTGAQLSESHYITLRCVALRCVALRCVALRCVALRCVALRCVALRCAALRCAALRCAALRCIYSDCNRSGRPSNTTVK